MRTACLTLVLLGCLAFLVLSFHPRVRFGDPMPGGQTIDVRNRFPCIYQTIYENEHELDALYFGASKTNIAAKAGLIGKAYEAVTEEKLNVFTFSTPFSNAELVYFFFRDYLAHNPAPKKAFIELTANAPQPSVVMYAHAFFPDVAPPYLYLDVANREHPTKHQIFALADALRLLIRHVDLALARLLRADARFVVAAGDNCQFLEQEDSISSIDNPRHLSFGQLLEAEMTKLRPPVAPAEVGRKPALLDTYADNDLLTRHLHTWNDKRLWRIGKRFWLGPELMRNRNIDYYRSAVELGKAHGVDVSFYYLPNIFEPKPFEESVEQLSSRLGAPVHTLRYWYTRIAYHHYVDASHSAPEMARAYAIWFASLVEESGKN